MLIAGAQPHPILLPGNECLILRTIQPQDAEGLQAYVRGLSSESRRNRFLGTLGELAPTRLDDLIRMRGPRQVVLLALTQIGSKLQTVAEAMLVVATDSERGEIALSVTDTWQHRGLGTVLTRHLEARARRVGVRYLFGDVLRTNTAMKGLARKTGYSVRSLFTDARLVEIVKDLAPANARSVRQAG
jgi:acetyltransferase